MTETGGLIVRDSGLDAVCERLSTMSTVKLDVPVAAGVPLITPSEDKVRPDGNVPELSVHS